MGMQNKIYPGEVPGYRVCLLSGPWMGFVVYVF